jgi:hypothetical protein
MALYGQPTEIQNMQNDNHLMGTAESSNSQIIKQHTIPTTIQ